MILLRLMRCAIKVENSKTFRTKKLLPPISRKSLAKFDIAIAIGFWFIWFIWLFWEVLFVVSFVPAKSYLLKASNLSTRVRCESCSFLRMSMLAIFNINDVNWCQLHGFSVFIVDCKHISNFLLIVDSEQANVCLVHIEKASTFEDKIGHMMRYVVVF